MRRYHCKINVGNEALTTVSKENISAAEVLVLQALHGVDNVRDIAKGHMDKSSHADELAHLQARYENSKVGEPAQPVLIAVFGPATAGRKLPVELEEDEENPFPFALGVEEAEKAAKKAA